VAKPALEGTDIVEAALPDMLVDEARRQPLARMARQLTRPKLFLSVDGRFRKTFSATVRLGATIDFW